MPLSSPERARALARRLSFYRTESAACADATKAQPHTAPAHALLRLSWRDDVSELKDLLDMATDWGPFELSKVRVRAGGAVCRFRYHGRIADAACAFADLVDCVARVAPCRRALLRAGTLFLIRSK